ncbi:MULTISPECIES: MgtC/SapB family protein [Methylococcus]|uniref:Protein MgtC n=1 Tax=Methylococcus capsulatus TaxID=414 RepID=A0ABZ2F2V7_METCP|nr:MULTISPECIES: MgtC/SapB family protein [Methylococcus]MDF9392217.1 MgtC/SapB family protein [Methylococcus capsulatus]
MEAIQNINTASLLDTLVSLAAAFLLGTAIGLERQFRQRTAGLRTNVLVALGAAIFVDMANRLHGPDGAVRVVAYVVSGVGFLGAGVIMREQGNVRGLNTAATLWGSAAVGACAGADLILEALVATVFVLAANTLLRPLVERINRQPIDTPAVEVTHTVYVIAPRRWRKDALALVEQVLQEAGYPLSDLAVHAFGDEEIEIEATLAAASVDGSHLEHILKQLKEHPVVGQAFWSPSTLE